MDSGDFLIVVVDDDISFREALVSLLESYGYRTAAFASALEYLEAEPAPSCLVLDVRMPRMTGFELHSRLAAREAKFPVIFVSSFADEGTRRQALGAGATAIFSKLSNPAEMIQTIRSVLNQGLCDRVAHGE